ncbi:MAG: hypothetical protein ACYSU5_12530 [Planctomycetota bacterium]
MGIVICPIKPLFSEMILAGKEPIRLGIADYLDLIVVQGIVLPLRLPLTRIAIGLLQYF